MRRLVVLRPEPGASVTVGKARERGLDAVAVPLFTIEPLAWDGPEPGEFDGLLLTSANAVRHGGNALQRYRGLPVYAVGDATAAAARAEGFDVAATGEGGVEDLLESLAPDLELLHLAGADRREPGNARQRIIAVPVYRADPIADPDLGGCDGAVALVHSPRAARRFADLIPERGSVAVIAISNAAADVLGDGWESVVIADRPSDDAVLALAARLCNKPDP